MATQDLDYYRQRADEELAAAKQAGDPAIAEIHREMARRYRDRFNEEADGIYSQGQLAQPIGASFAEPGLLPA